MQFRSIDRRDFLKCAGLSAAALTLPMDVARGGIKGKPNILWISVEDISPDLGCYGDDYAVTPNLDALASESTRFTNAFAPAGVCAPARSAIITGMYPTTMATHNMRCKGVPPPEVKCFTEYLRAAGYYCTNNAKTDYQFDPPVTAWDECNNKAHWRSRGKDQPFFSVFNLTVTHESRIRSHGKGLLKRLAEIGPHERHDPEKAVLPPYYPDTDVVRADWARYADLITVMDKEVGRILAELKADGLEENTIVWFFSDHGRGLPRGKRWLYDSGTHVPLMIRMPSGESLNDDLVSFVDFGPTALSLAGVEVPEHMQGRPFLGPQKAEARRYIFGARDRMDETYDLIRAARDHRFKYIRNFMPYLSYGQDIEYMNAMPTMQAMRRLHKEGKLEGPEKLYFQPIKPKEELYDLENDPHEICNLAGNPEYREHVKRMGERLYRWMREIGDIGLIPEPDLNELMRPGGTWAKTAPPRIVEITAEGCRLTSDTPGASIAYKVDKDWKLYSAPIPFSGSIRAKACRIGYRDSDEVVLEAESPSSETAPEHWRNQVPPSLLDQLLEIKTHDGEWKKGVEAYLEALDHEEAAMRYWAVVGLHLAGEKEPLDEYLKDPSPSVRIAAAEALCDLSVLEASFNSTHEAERVFAGNSLSRLGDKVLPILTVIESGTKDKSRDVAKLCRNILSRL